MDGRMKELMSFFRHREWRGMWWLVCATPQEVLLSDTDLSTIKKGMLPKQHCTTCRTIMQDLFRCRLLYLGIPRWRYDTDMTPMATYGQAAMRSQDALHQLQV